MGGALVMWWWLASCALAPIEPSDCVQDQECRQAFGLGSVCAADGRCRMEGPHPRCAQSYPLDLWDRPSAYADHVVLGALFDLGPDGPNLRSAQLALNEVNGAGGVQGTEVAMVQCTYHEDLGFDQLSMEEAVVETSRYLADTVGVPAIIGPGTSGMAVIAFDTLEDDDILLIAPSATSPQLIDIDGDVSTDDDPGLFWRPAPPDDAQALAILVDMESRGIDQVAIIYQNNVYGEALTDLVVDGHSGTEVLFAYDSDNGRNAAVADAAYSDVQEVMFIASDVLDVVAFLNSASLLDGYVDKTLFLTDAAYDAYLLESTSPGAQDLFEKVRGSRPSTPSGSVYDAFLIAYASAYNGEDPSTGAFNAYAYDAGWMSLYGLSWAMLHGESVGGTTMAQGLRRLHDPGSSIAVGPGDWLLAEQQFEQGAGFDLQGASGHLDFDPITGETANPIDIWTVSPDGFQTVRVCGTEGTCTTTSK